MARDEAQALLASLEEVAPRTPTACAGWSMHDIVAHLAAGSKEIADLIEEKLADAPARPTRAFEDREPPFRALPDGELRRSWAYHARRKTEAVAALAALGPDATFAFTGTNLTAAGISTHSRSEAAIHRWDVVGDDSVSAELLSQPELTAHAVSVLNAMPVLSESPRARMGQVGRESLRVVLRSEGRPDVVLATDVAEGARLDLVEAARAEGDAVVETDPAGRLLAIWGRRSSTRSTRVDADPATRKAVTAVLWPDAVSWPR